MRFVQRGNRRTRAAAVVVGATALVGAVLAPPADAAGSLSSSTTLSASPASATVGTPVTLTATIKVLGLDGLGVTPTGTVSFTSNNAVGTTVALGSAPVGACLLTTCTATLTTSAMPVGTTQATGSYSGDGLVAPSSGSTAVTITAPPSGAPAGTVTCYAGDPCSTGNLQSTDGTTGLNVTAAPSSQTQTVSGSLGAGTLPCKAGGKPDNDGDDDDGVFVGALATFSSTAPDATKTIDYTGNGTTGSIMYHQYSEHTAYAGCYASPKPFNGYTSGKYGPAPLINGQYVAMLSNCANNGGALPCVTNVKGSGSTDTYRVKAPAGDPKIVG
jgi:hypothetical protein